MKQVLQDELLSWFEKNQRDLPWRHDRDPYKIWVSEIMLQQTQVDTVIPYFQRFIEQFPTLTDLADAEEDKVIKAWEGLGYYSRVRNLHSAVKEVREHFNGVVPDREEEVSQLKGVGPYTAGAILSIAYGKRVPAVDGNVMRVISRIFNLHDDIAKAGTRKNIEKIVAELIPEGYASYFNQALMELGALICTPRSPKCPHCPVRDICEARAAGVEETLPVKTKAKKPKVVNMAVGVVFKGDQFLIRRRPSTGLLAGLWEFPGTEKSELLSLTESLLQHLAKEMGIETKISGELEPVQHVFSHLSWDMRAYRCEWISGEPNEGKWAWVTLEELNDYTLPVAFQKIVKQLTTLN